MELKYLYAGKQYTLRELADQAAPGVNERVLRRRIRDGWSTADAVTIPAGNHRTPRKGALIVDDIRLYIVCCFVQRFILDCWHDEDAPVTRTGDSEYQLDRGFYTWQFRFTDAMTFQAAAYFRRTGRISWPVYECVFGGGIIRIVNHIQPDGRHPVTQPPIDARANTTRMPEAYKRAKAMHG